MKMLDEVTDTVIMANPKILSLNRQPSRVLVGRRVGYLSTTSTDTSTTQTVEFLDTGTQLYFRPFVSADGEIRMELKPQVSEAIIREATDATGAAVSIPDEVTQGLTTNVLVRDGQTVVLGGLFRESTQYGRRQVPFLGDIPIIGAAFRGHDDETQRSEILFLITPTIVNDSHINETADRAVADIDRLRAGSRQGLLWWSREKMTSALNVEAERAARDGDYEKATFNLSRSLALNPIQPDALRLREKITGERETWPKKSLLSNMFDDEAAKKIAEIKPAPAGLKWKKPYGSHDLPRQKIAAPGEPQSNAAPAPTSYRQGASSPFFPSVIKRCSTPPRATLLRRPSSRAMKAWRSRSATTTPAVANPNCSPPEASRSGAPSSSSRSSARTSRPTRPTTGASSPTSASASTTAGRTSSRPGSSASPPSTSGSGGLMPTLS